MLDRRPAGPSRRCFGWAAWHGIESAAQWSHLVLRVQRGRARSGRRFPVPSAIDVAQRNDVAGDKPRSTIGHDQHISISKGKLSA